MACSLEFVKYVADQLGDAGGITYKKLFGEYGLWRHGKFFGTIEHDQVYVKVTEAAKRLMPEARIESPHEGASMYLVEELEDREFLARLVTEICEELPAPAVRKKRKS